MDFFYPNFNNDFWRIQGLVFFDDPTYFEIPLQKRFDREKIEAFCVQKGLAFFDTAGKVCRLKANASDGFLEILEPSDIPGTLGRMPLCRTIITTGRTCLHPPESDRTGDGRTRSRRQFRFRDHGKRKAPGCGMAPCAVLIKGLPYETRKESGILQIGFLRKLEQFQRNVTVSRRILCQIILMILFGIVEVFKGADFNGQRLGI